MSLIINNNHYIICYINIFIYSYRVRLSDIILLINSVKGINPNHTMRFINTMRFISDDRNYSSWRLENEDGNKAELGEIFCPLNKKLLTGDIINQKCMLISSVYRNKKDIPGILVLSGQTHGRNSKGKLLYKCIPDDKGLPIFLIPYADKKSKFSKNLLDTYVTFTFVSWEDRHPMGSLTKNIGVVSDKINYFEYELARKELGKVLCNTKVIKALAAREIDKLVLEMKDKYNLEDRTMEEVITIDPDGAQDFDDAISIIKTDKGERISVYIANVPIWLDMINMWSIIKERYSTIYLPHRIIHMLPPLMSNRLCSLIEGHERPAIAMDIYLENNQITDIRFQASIIKVAKNYRYQEDILLSNRIYQELLLSTFQLQKEMPYISVLEDSHNVVAFYMIMMNHQVAKCLYSYRKGIVRNKKVKKSELSCSNKLLPDFYKDFLDGFYGDSAKYINACDSLGHDLIGWGLDHYTHCTSPIRRIVDLVNLTILQDKVLELRFAGEFQEIIDNIINDLDKTNTVMKNISKVQNNCELLNYCYSRVDSNDILVDGYIMEINEIDVKGLKQWEALIYVNELSTIIRIIMNSKEEINTKHKFSIHIFNDDKTLRRKVRLMKYDIPEKEEFSMSV